MADHLTKQGRSRVMAAIRSTDTKAELLLRRTLRASGALGYRIHVKALPGRPDIAYTRWHLAIFVDGVFWHGHPDHFNPETASPYWRDKIAGNQNRDRRANEALAGMGWSVLRFWDLAIKEDVVARSDEVLRALAAVGWNGRGFRPRNEALEQHVAGSGPVVPGTGKADQGLDPGGDCLSK